MIESISTKIAIAIKNTSGNDQASLAVIRFGLNFIMNFVAVFILSLGFGIISGHLLEVMLALISFSILRMVSGGYHLKTSTGCIVFTVITMVAIPFLPITSTINLLMTITSLLLVLLFAPSNIEKQTRVPERYFFVFKIIAACITSTNLYLQVDVLSISFFIQSLSLVKVRGFRIDEEKTG